MIEENIKLAKDYIRFFREKTRSCYKNIPNKTVKSIENFPIALEAIIDEDSKFKQFKEDYKTESAGIGRGVYVDLRRIITYGGVDELIKLENQVQINKITKFEGKKQRYQSSIVYSEKNQG